MATRFSTSNLALKTWCWVCRVLKKHCIAIYKLGIDAPLLIYTGELFMQFPALLVSGVNICLKDYHNRFLARSQAPRNVRLYMLHSSSMAIHFLLFRIRISPRILNKCLVAACTSERTSKITLSKKNLASWKVSPKWVKDDQSSAFFPSF